MLLEIWSTRPLGTQIAAHCGVRASRRRAFKKVRKSGTPTPSTSVLGTRDTCRSTHARRAATTPGNKGSVWSGYNLGHIFRHGQAGNAQRGEVPSYPKHKGLKHRNRTVYTWRSPVEPGMEYSPGPTSAVLCTNKSGRLPVPKPTPA